MSELEQSDLIYLAKRCKIVEDAVIRMEDAFIAYNKDIAEWTEFMSTELFKQG